MIVPSHSGWGLEKGGRISQSLLILSFRIYRLRRKKTDRAEKGYRHRVVGSDLEVWVCPS
jgi:hypothetical protein